VGSGLGKQLNEEVTVTEEYLPEHYQNLKTHFEGYFKSLDDLGQVIRSQGPLDEKMSHLAQLAAAIAVKSEGSTHSHIRRALKAGATKQEIYHCIILLTTIIGFPAVSAALSWAKDVLKEY
jgi:alkylhydroperoxidase/carboxymuconolactone decarboxylase family protein YurZ